MDFAIGTQVEYGRPNGVKLNGEIIKVNQKSYLIKYPWNVGSGSVRVSKSLVRILNPVQAEPVPVEPVQAEPVQEPVQAEPVQPRLYDGGYSRLKAENEELKARRDTLVSDVEETRALLTPLLAQNVNLRKENVILRKENSRFRTMLNRFKNAIDNEIA